MKRKEIMALDKSEYESKIHELRKELIKLSAQAATGTAMKNSGAIRLAKKNIARILTLTTKNKRSSNKA